MVVSLGRAITHRVKKPVGVTAAPNLISFGRLCRSAIDHRRHSTNAGQCAIGRVVNLESAGTGSGPSTLFIDDARYNIDAAQALGWTGIRFDNSAQVRQDLLLMGAL